MPGAHKPDRNGLYLLFPLRTGILSQPQEEQYIVEGTAADLSIKTTSWVNTWGTVKVKVNAWQEQADGSWLNKGSIGNFLIEVGFLDRQNKALTSLYLNCKRGTTIFSSKQDLIKSPSLVLQLLITLI